MSLRLKTYVYLYINLKFGLQFFPNKPTFSLDLPAEALGFKSQAQSKDCAVSCILIYCFGVSLSQSSFIAVTLPARL